MRFTLPCSATNLRGKLKHSVLENVILRQRPDVLAEICRTQPSEPEGWRRLVSELLGHLPEAYSPVALLDMLAPLRHLDKDRRRRLASRLQGLYEMQCIPTLQLPELSQSAGCFVKALTAFEDAVRKDHTENWRGLHAALLIAARHLSERLDNLPRGVWLP